MKKCSCNSTLPGPPPPLGFGAAVAAAHSWLLLHRLNWTPSFWPLYRRTSWMKSLMGTPRVQPPKPVIIFPSFHAFLVGAVNLSVYLRQCIRSTIMGSSFGRGVFYFRFLDRTFQINFNQAQNVIPARQDEGWWTEAQQEGGHENCQPALH